MGNTKKKAPAAPKRKRGTAKTQEGPRALWCDDFLAELRDSGSVYHAAAKAGVSRVEAYRHRDRDPAFAERWGAAIDEANGGLERSALQRARDGTDDLQLHEGVPCVDPLTGQNIVRRKHETALTIFMLKKRIPGRYGDAQDDASEPMALGPMDDFAQVEANRREVTDAYNRGAISGSRFDRIMRSIADRRAALVEEKLEREVAELRAEIARLKEAG